MILFDLILDRMEIGRARYGHGLRVEEDTTNFGTPVNSWLHMALEEYLDAYIYVLCDYIRKHDDYRRTDVEDDNQRILYLMENMDEIESEEHVIMLKYLTELIKMSIRS